MKLLWKRGKVVEDLQSNLQKRFQKLMQMKRSQKEMWLKSLPKLRKNKQKKQMITVIQVQVLHASILFMKSTKR